MYARVEKPKENKSRAVTNSVGLKKNNVKQGFGFVDNRKTTSTSQWGVKSAVPISASYSSLSNIPLQLQPTESKDVIQAYKLSTPKAIRDKLTKLEVYTETENDSLSKEFPSWFGANKEGRLRDYDFEDDQAFLGMIQEMVTTVDDFTDQQGFALRDQINQSLTSKIFIGYNAGNAAYADAMERDGLKTKAVASGLKADMQLSHGHYISPSRSELDSYIAERTFAGKDAVVYKVYIDLRNVVNYPIMMKGASIKEWWSNYDTSFDDDYDIVVAALSGHTNIIQYKINPKSYHLVTFEVVERHAKKPNK